MRQLLVDWGIALAIAAVVFAVWRVFAPGPPTEGPAPSLVALDSVGATFDLAGVTHDAYVINFWATWCGPCRQEIPEFSRFAEAHPEVGVYGVSVDDALPTEKVVAAAARYGARYPILHDPRGTEATRWGVNVFPTTFVLDAQRRIVAVKAGALDLERLEALLPSR